MYVSVAPQTNYLLHLHLQVVLHIGFFFVMKKKNKPENGILDRMRVLLFSLGSNLKIHEVRSKRALQRRDSYADCTKNVQNGKNYQ